MTRLKTCRMMAIGTGVLVTLAACGDSSTAPGGEQEVISRVTLTLTPPSGTALTTFIDDSDGPGTQPPSAQVNIPALARGITYTGTVRFENRLVNPVEDVTQEVLAEANEHRVFFTATGSGVTITTTDTDPQGRPLGLRFSKSVASNATGGSVRLILCHYGSRNPKTAAATSCTAGTDVDVTFAYTIAP
jgi:hypothetical protein